MRESLPALSLFYRREIYERKGTPFKSDYIIFLQLFCDRLLFAMMLVSPSAASLKNPVSITVEAKSKKKAAKKSTTRKPTTRTNYITMKKKEKLWVGPSVAAMHPETKDWKSSNSKIATVSTKGDEEGFHKVTVKKKRTGTISCEKNSPRMDKR